MARYKVTQKGSKAIAGHETVRTGLQPLFDGDFDTPDGWATNTQQHMRDLSLAQAEGAANISELGPDYIPIEWKENYRNETSGPRGEPLPSAAKGWLPTGKPDFGGGYAGVYQSALYNIYERPRGDITIQDIGAFGPTATSLRDAVAGLNFDESSFEGMAATGQSLARFAGVALPHGIQYLKDLWATAEDNETIFGKTTQFIGSAFELIIGTAEETAKQVETEVIGPHILASDELIKLGAERGIIPEYEAEWMDGIFGRQLGGFSALAPIAVAAKYRLKGLITERDYAAALDRNSDAARMAYTAWFDPAAKEEYRRRMQEGDDPRLLALELENPGAEMVGRIIFDPLNLIDVAQIGAIVSRSLRLNRARREFTIIADPALAKAFENLATAGEVGMPAASREVINALGDMYDATRESRLETAGRRGFFLRTAGGKRANYGQRASTFMSTIHSASGNNPDLANSVWHGLVLAADTDKAKQLEGLTVLSQAIADSKGALTPGILFSPSANETAILLRNLLLDDDGKFNPNVLLKMLEDAGDDPEKLAVLLDRKLSDALAKDFPTIQEQVKLNDEYAELLKVDEADAARFLERNPLASRDPGVFYKNIAKADDFLQPIYRRMGEFQSRLFMGTAPASWRYRANNRWGNFIPTLVDVGPEAAIKGIFGVSPKGSLDETARMLGGVLPEGAVRGLGPAQSFRGGELTEAKNDWFDRFTTAGLRGAARDEAANAAHVVNKSVQRTMKSYMKAERRLINKELAGLSDEQRKLLTAAMREKYYNVDDAIDVLRSEDGYDISRNFAFLNDDEIEELRELRIYDAALQAARENDSLDDVLRRIDEILEERSRAGMVAGGETPAINIDNVSGQSIARDADFIEEFGSSRDADVFQRRRVEAREVERLYDEAVFGQTGLQRMATEQIMRNSFVEGARIGMTDDQKIKLGMAQLDGVTGPIQQEIRTATDAAFEAGDLFRDNTRDLTQRSRGRRAGDPWLNRQWAGFDGVAKEFGLPGIGDPPRGLTAQQLRDAVWGHETSSYRHVQNERWSRLRDQNVDRYREVARRLAAAAGIEDFHTPAVNAAEAQLTRSQMMDSAELAEDGTMIVKGIPEEEFFAADAIGRPEETIPLQERWFTSSLDDANTYFQEVYKIDPDNAVVTYIDVPVDEASNRTARQVILSEELTSGELRQAHTSRDYDTDHIVTREQMTGRRILNDDTPPVPEGQTRLYRGEHSMFVPTEDMPVVGSMDDAAPTPFRVFHETQPAAVDAGERLKQGIRDNWGQTGRMGALDPDTEEALLRYATGARGRVTEARAQAIGVANQTRDFILHNYPDRYGGDLVAGYIWPYQFWHSRTYMKWMGRMVMHPGMVAAYSHYRSALEKQHAGLPAWWRRNINVTDLLGIETDSPLWFNLERSLNPIQGLTGVDFSDPRRRLDNWSATIEDLNKFGPSVWMPYQVALALKYHIDGEEEAASRWAGRLWSPTGAFRDLTALMDPEGLGVELDPFIHLFSGGIGPWERGRIGRQFGAMQTEGQYPQAELIDAARLREGPIWDEARARAINQRAPNVPSIVAPFFLGGGFKMRTESDTQIDMFYSEMFGLIRMKEDLEPEEYRQEWNDLERRYPFMDVLLLSKRSGLDRDEALAWSVLDRIPPAMTDDIAEMVGIDPDIIDLFRESNGNLEEMTEADRLQFLGAILEMAAILDVPNNATKAEWETASSMYREMRIEGESLFGENIWERVDGWYAVYDPEDTIAADDMMKRDPGIQQALDWQQRMIMTTPLMGAYYTSEERIRKFYKGQMYDAAEAIFGEDLWDHLAVQSALFDAGDRKAAFQYRDDHPQLKGWTELRDQTLPLIDAKVDRIGSILPESIEPVFRDREMADLPDGPPEPSREDWINSQVLAYATGQQQEDAPEDVKKFIREMADNQWPGTRSEADLYYKRLEKKVSVAQKMLMHNSALAARVAWESEALKQLVLVQEGRFAETGAQAEVVPPTISWFEWQSILTIPVWRLVRDNLSYGDSLLDSETEELEEVAERLGLGFDELMLRLEAAYQEEEGALTDATPVQ